VATGDLVAVKERQRASRQNSTSQGSRSTVLAARMVSGKIASAPQVTMAANRPRCRVSRPASGTAAELASAVTIRATANPLPVLMPLVASATGNIRSVMPGGCTMMKSR
jgi:hypothetical protein